MDHRVQAQSVNNGCRQGACTWSSLLHYTVINLPPMFHSRCHHLVVTSVFPFLPLLVLLTCEGAGITSTTTSACLFQRSVAVSLSAWGCFSSADHQSHVVTSLRQAPSSCLPLCSRTFLLDTLKSARRRKPRAPANGNGVLVAQWPGGLP